MHGNTKIKFVNAKQAKTYYNYKNNKRKMYGINAAIWYNKKCKLNGLTPNYINIKVNGSNKQSQELESRRAVEQVNLHVHLPVPSVCTFYIVPEDGCVLHPKHVEQIV